MIWLSRGLYHLCLLHALHPTLFIQDGDCLLMCSPKDMPPHACYADDGQPLTDCFDEEHRSQLCDAYWVEITPEDYEVTP